LIPSCSTLNGRSDHPLLYLSVVVHGLLHAAGGGSKFQVLYPPRYPVHHLSAKCTDQLCPIVVQPRIARTTRAKEFCTTLGISRQYSNFSGIDSCDVGLNGNSSVTSELLCGHESLALAGRPDLHALLSHKVVENQILQDFASSMNEESIRRHPTGSLAKFVQGATFVPFGDAIYIQLGIGEVGENTIPCIKPHSAVVVQCRRSWARTIYTVQTEDMNRYGTHNTRSQRSKGSPFNDGVVSHCYVIFD